MKPNKQQSQGRRKSMAKANNRDQSKLPPIPQPPLSSLEHLHHGGGLPDRLRQLHSLDRESFGSSSGAPGDVNLVVETFNLCGDFAQHHQRRYMGQQRLRQQQSKDGGCGGESGPGSLEQQPESLVSTAGKSDPGSVTSQRLNKLQRNQYRHRVWCTDLAWPCGMTNFHFILIMGVGGFMLFWTLLLLRVYVPDRYWTAMTASADSALEGTNDTSPTPEKQ